MARPVLPPVRVWRWLRRKPALAASIAGSLLLGAVALVRQLETRHLAATLQEDKLAAHSIAVLPFLNLDTARPDNAFMLAIAHSLQANLSRLGPARVTAVFPANPFWSDTASVADMREANLSLHARTILTGSERLVKGKLRISMRLLSAATGDTLATKSMDMAPNGGVIGESAGGMLQPIYSALEATDWSAITIAGRDPGLRNQTAREFIISGRELMFRDSIEDLDRSLHCLEKAIELEPKSAIAHAYLSASAASRIHFQWDAQLLARAEREAKQALLLEPGLPDGHRSLAGVYFQTGRFEEALEEQFRAMETGGPEEHVASSLGETLERLGRPVRAIGWLEMARYWTSRPGAYDAFLGDCWIELGDGKEAENAYRRAMELRPGNSDGWVGLCHQRLLEGNSAAARQLCRENRDRSNRDKASDVFPDQMAAQIEFFTRNYPEAERLYRELNARDPSKGANFYGSVTYGSALGRLQQLEGQEVKGLTTLRRVRSEELSSPTSVHSGAALYRLAAVEYSLGNTAAGRDYLREAALHGWSDFRSPRLDPRFDAAARDPHFDQLLSNLGDKAFRDETANRPSR